MQGIPWVLQVASLDANMGRFASRIMLQAHRQEILVVQPSPPEAISDQPHQLPTMPGSSYFEVVLSLPACDVRVQNLKEVVKELLIEFVRANGGRKPARIIFFRDGVSEGQFQQVTHYCSSGLHSHVLTYAGSVEKSYLLC